MHQRKSNSHIKFKVIFILEPFHWKIAIVEIPLQKANSSVTASGYSNTVCLTTEVLKPPLKKQLSRN